MVMRPRDAEALANENAALKLEIGELKTSMSGKMVCACEREHGGDWRIKMCGAHEMEFEKRCGGLQARERQATEARDKVFSQLHESNRLIGEVRKALKTITEISADMEYYQWPNSPFASAVRVAQDVLSTLPGNLSVSRNDEGGNPWTPNKDLPFDRPQCVEGGNPGPDGGWVGGVWSHEFRQTCTHCGVRLL